MNRKTRMTLIVLSATAAAVLGAAVGYWFAYRAPQAPATVSAPDKSCPDGKVLYWTDPMVPGYRSDKPGKSPFMDMELVPVCEEGGGGAPVVTIRPEILNNLGVRTYPVVREARPRRLTADGYLLRTDGTLRVFADVFERHITWLRPGLPAEVRVLALPGRKFAAVVERVEADIAVGARSLKAVVRLKETDPALVPGWFAEVTIQAPPAGERLYVPREALIRTGTRNAVVLALGEGRFQPVEVEPGEEDDEWIEIRRGLKEGDRVVTSGQFLIDSEASLRASFQRLQADARQPDAPAAAAVSAQGVIRAVEPGARRLKIEHEPIAELGWPSMTMDFPVAAGVSLAERAVGETVRFELQRQPDGTYLITAIAPAHRH